MGPAVVLHAPKPGEAASEAAAPPPRDWVAWYDELEEEDRRAFRDALLNSSVDEVRADVERRMFFLLHVDDVVCEGAPGSERLLEPFLAFDALREARDSEGVERRKRAAAYLFEAYRGFLRDNPWAS